MDDVIGFDFTYPIKIQLTNGPNLWRITLENADIEITRQRLRPQLTAYSQRDPRWKDDVYAGGKTFGQAGCYVVCVAMIASVANYELTPPEVAEKLRDVGCFEGPNLSYPQNIPQALPRLAYGGTIDWRKKRADIDRLQTELNYGPTIVEVEFNPGGTQPPDDQHFVVAEKLVSNGAAELLITDPWDGAATRLLERYALDHWDLGRAIYGLRLLRVQETECAI